LKVEPKVKVPIEVFVPQPEIQRMIEKIFVRSYPSFSERGKD